MRSFLPNILRSITLTNLTRPFLYSHPPPPSSFAAARNPLLTYQRSLPTLPFIGALFSTAKPDMTNYEVKKSDAEWQAILSPDQFRVIREKGTEAPFTGEYDKHMPSAGVYVCFHSHPSPLSPLTLPFPFPSPRPTDLPPPLPLVPHQ